MDCASYSWSEPKIIVMVLEICKSKWVPMNFVSHFAVWCWQLIEVARDENFQKASGFHWKVPTRETNVLLHSALLLCQTWLSHALHECSFQGGRVSPSWQKSQSVFCVGPNPPWVMWKQGTGELLAEDIAQLCSILGVQLLAWFASQAPAGSTGINLGPQRTILVRCWWETGVMLSPSDLGY